MGEARFQWWIQTNFKVLPTDPRFMDLTDEQVELMFQHFLIDNPTVKKKVENEDGTYAEPDRYYDPDFDDAWNDTDEEEVEEPDYEGKDLERVNAILDQYRDTPSDEGDQYQEPVSEDEQWEEV